MSFLDLADLLVYGEKDAQFLIQQQRMMKAQQEAQKIKNAEA